MTKNRVVQLNGKKGGIDRSVAELEAMGRPVSPTMRDNYAVAVQELESLKAAKGNTQSITKTAIPKATSKPSKPKAAKASDVDEDLESSLGLNDPADKNTADVKQKSIGDPQGQGLFDDTPYLGLVDTRGLELDLP